MAVNTQSPSNVTEKKETIFTNSTFLRVTRYILVRLIALLVTVVIGIYLTIVIANMGGHVDTIMKNSIREDVTSTVANAPAYRNMEPEARRQLIAEMIALREKRLGLDTPLAVRSFNYLIDGLTLNLGRAIHMISDSGSKTVRLILLERLPPTLLLMGTSQLFLFFISVFLALSLSRNYGSFWDKLVIALSPTSSAPSWFYGIFLILIFAAVFKILPFGGLVDSPPPNNPFSFGLNVLKHLILPTASLVISAFFLSIYSWRTFFLIYSSEDYVEMAKAKGLPPRDIETRYILRPTLPAIVTSFALTLIGLWGGALFTETVFQWPGLGRTLFTAIGLYDVPVIVGSTIIYAYLLALTVFLLDFFYVLVDPRVKVGGS